MAANPDQLLAEKTTQKLQEPPKYAVILLNDNYSTFDFVVKVLMVVFKKSITDAIKITNDVHHKGRGACGYYSREIAETKIAQVEAMSEAEGYPLKCIMEKM
ncbi:MAG: ATP-dependent Clp protease adaptor ClpS [Bacteroidetes bacterium]|nr:ATP-dependent Clp protease adaptor ClpS [Bacteroidota bacterium]MCH8523548.1 ATP-dependent Clp protease adaptor ClpS [Balneolales bacterium]